MPAGSLTTEEIEIISALTKIGYARPFATLMTVLFSRQHARPENELLDTVSTYPWLKDERDRNRAYQEMKDGGYLIDLPSSSGLPPIIKAAPGIQDKLSREIPQCREQILALSNIRSNVKILGHMGDPDVYDTLPPFLERAQTSIVMPMIMTTPENARIETLIKQAELGVKIRILLATPKLAGQIRGNTNAPESRNRIYKWKEAAKSSKNLDVRVTRHDGDIKNASSALIDGSILRYDIYDNANNRSTQGTMIEVSAPGATNIVRLFSDDFNDSWRKARPLGIAKSVNWALARWGWGVIALLAIGAALSLVVGKTAALPLLLGAVASYSLDRTSKIRDWLKEKWDKIRD